MKSSPLLKDDEWLAKLDRSSPLHLSYQVSEKPGPLSQRFSLLKLALGFYCLAVVFASAGTFNYDWAGYEEHSVEITRGPLGICRGGDNCTVEEFDDDEEVLAWVIVAGSMATISSGLAAIFLVIILLLQQGNSRVAKLASIFGIAAGVLGIVAVIVWEMGDYVPESASYGAGFFIFVAAIILNFVGTVILFMVPST